MSAMGDLFEDAGRWTQWAQREETWPLLAMRSEPGGLALAIGGAGNAEEIGGWICRLPALQAGRRYRLEAACQTRNIPYPGLHVWALTGRGSSEQLAFFHELDFAGTRDGLLWHEAEIEARQTIDDLWLVLALSGAEHGEVVWRAARIADATDRPVARRVAKLAAVNGRPEAPRSSDDCLAWYLERLEEAGAMGADLVCLGEVINIDGVPDGRQKVAELVPGPWTEAMGEAARRHRMWIGAGLQERSGRRRHNTCVLIDRQGALAGRYRKTHQTIGEQIFSGRFSGADFPVFDTDFGKVAMMICYDYHFPEVARLLALQGAEVILLPNMGDNREGGALWEPCVRTRALDNGVHIVAALNGGRSCVASPKGELLSIVGREKGAIAIADCEIGATLCDFTGRPVGRRYFRIRRADLFGQMMRHAWEYK